jgi:hypothetical protein
MLGVLLVVFSATCALGYGGDTHYYLHFATALETCFTWDEAHVIASSDYLVDKNRTTTAEKHPLKKHNKINWHAFSRDQERFNVLWERVLKEQDEELKLVKLGQFLHFASDWESHYGYGVRMGHGVPTIFARDPDSLGNNRLNNMRMIGQITYHMLAVCSEWGREPETGTDPDRALVELHWEYMDEPLMDTLFETNTPRWKKWGKRWKMGKRILAENHLMIEEIVARRGAMYPDRDVPEDFTPGDPERGIPPPLGVRYDKDGELEEILGVELQLMPEYDGSAMSRVEEEQLEEALETELVDDLEELVQDGKDLDLNANVQLSLQDADLADDAWLVRVEIENLGNGASKPGRLDLFVLDVGTEELLGETVIEVDAIGAEERVDSLVRIESQGEPTRRVIIGASLKVDDLSADNNDVWFVPWRNEVADLHKVKEKKKKKNKREPGSIEFFGKPKMWIGDDKDVHLVLMAYVTGGDSSRRLGDISVRLGENELHIEGLDALWFSVPDLRRRLVPARGIFLLPPAKEMCADLEQGDRKVEITVGGAEGEDVEPGSMTIELEEPFVEVALAICRQDAD